MNIKELREKQEKEIDKFIEECPHLDVSIEDTSFGNRRDITIRCNRCRLNLAGYFVSRNQSYMSYVRDCVAKYPGNIRE